MTYELAKKLKDVGFPLKTDTYEAFSHIEGFRYILPTLSELIEACGNKLGELENTYDGWRAYCYDAPDPLITWAKTPEEAVANLWLELNAKS